MTDTTPGRLDAHEARLYTLSAPEAGDRWASKRLTLVSQRTGARYTYRVSRPPGDSPERPWLISVLAGQDNEADYRYLGTLRPAGFSATAKTGTLRGSISFAAFDFFARRVLQAQGDMPAGLEVWHDGRCGMCGRTLTTPESVALGLGPICASRVGA
jgi:hypothetical protein